MEYINEEKNEQFKEIFKKRYIEASIDREAKLEATSGLYKFIATNFRTRDTLLIETDSSTMWRYAMPLNEDNGKFYTRYVIDSVATDRIVFWHEQAREYWIVTPEESCFSDTSCRSAIIRPNWKVHFADSMVHKKSCLDSYKTVAIYEPPVTFKSITKKILDKMDALGLSDEEKKILMEEYTTNSLIKYTP